MDDGSDGACGLQIVECGWACGVEEEAAKRGTTTRNNSILFSPRDSAR